MTHINQSMIKILRTESPEIDSAFCQAERLNKNRVMVEGQIGLMRQASRRLKELELVAFRNAIGMVTG